MKIPDLLGNPLNVPPTPFGNMQFTDTHANSIVYSLLSLYIQH